jgi:hypothetical protein
MIEPQDQSDLADLVTKVERGIHPDPSDVLYRMIGFPPDSILYRGNALELHRTLSLRLSQSALAASGHVFRSVEQLLDGFIQQNDASDLATAIAWLDAELLAPLEDWTFVQELGFRTQVARIQVGNCTVVLNLDDVQPGIAATYAPTTRDLRPPFIFTTVAARDRFSARVLSIETFSEAEAVIALLAGVTEIPDVRYLIVNSPEDRYSTGPMAIAQIQAVDSAGNLWPGYHELSEALARPSAVRTDWEQRTLAASRWLRVASTTNWPSQSISASMSTLECLLVLPTERNKRVPISERTSDIGILKGKTRTEQVAWLQDLYGRRNDAVHGGVFYRDEIDAAGLLVLTKSVVHWAVQHLDPMHGRPVGGACATITEVLTTH